MLWMNCSTMLVVDLLPVGHRRMLFAVDYLMGSLFEEMDTDCLDLDDPLV
jgi:hypothetical protein